MLPEVRFFGCHREESIMDLNSVFLIVLAIVVGVGICCMGFCHCFRNKETPDGVDKA